MKKILFENNDVKVQLKNKNKIRDVLHLIFTSEGIQYQTVTYIFCNDLYLQNINRKFLNHETLTDIITFNLGVSAIEGEIYISIDRVAENAKKFNAIYQTELARVMIHGILHLCGYKDDTLVEKKNMRQKEDYYLKNLIT